MTMVAKLSLLAGAALAPATLFAQTVAPPVAWEDVPAASIGSAPQAGVTWQQRAAPPAFHGLPAAAARPSPEPAAESVPEADVQLAMARGSWGGVRRGSATRARGGMSVRGGSHIGARGHVSRPPVMHGGKHFGGKHNFKRMHKGSRMHNFWFGPRFRLNNWAVYGFAAPPPGWFWIRYYDDALLLDGNGVVRDHRGDMDWDRYGERWEYDGHGVPGYGGHGEVHAYGQPMPLPPGHAPAPHAYGYTITETTTVTSYGRGKGKSVTRTVHRKPQHVRRPYREHDDREEAYDAFRDDDYREDAYREDAYRDDAYRDDDYRDEPYEHRYDEDYGDRYEEGFDEPPLPPEPVPYGEKG